MTTIPTPNEIQAELLARYVRDMETARKSIAEQLRAMRFPATISTRSFIPDHIRGQILAEVKAAGWDAAYVSDPRDGDYLQIEAPR